MLNSLAIHNLCKYLQNNIMCQFNIEMNQLGVSFC